MNHSSFARLGYTAILMLALGSQPMLAVDGDSDGFDPPEDCNDGLRSANPAAQEICDGWDNDCDGLIDEGCVLQCPAPMAGMEVTVDDGVATRSQPVLAAGAAGLGVAWVRDAGGNRTLAFRHLDRWGDPRRDPLLVAEGSAVGDPAITTSGDYHGVAWLDDRNGNPEVWFTRFEDSVIPQVQYPVATGTATHRDPAVAWNGSVWGIAWVEGRHNLELHLALLSRFGNLTSETTGSSRVTEMKQSVIASGGSDFGVAWIDNRDGDLGVFFRSFDEALNPLTDEIRVDPATGQPSSPMIVWTGAFWLVAWVDEGSGGGDIRVVNLDADGLPSGPSVVLGSDPGPATRPAALFTGQETIIGWLEGFSGDVRAYVTRLNGSGGTLEEAVEVAGPGSLSGPAGIAWDGDGLRLSWLNGAGSVVVQELFCCGDLDVDGHDRCSGDCNDGDETRNPEAVEICNGIDDDCNGVVDDAVEGCPRYCLGLDTLSQPIVHRDGAFQRAWDVSAAFDGETFGLVWSQDPDMSVFQGKVVFRRLDQDGLPLGDPVILAAPPDERAEDPVITATPEGWAVAWFRTDSPTGASFQHLLPDGTKVGPVTETFSAPGENGALVHDGHGFGLAWNYNGGSSSDVRFRRYSGAGVPVGTMQYIDGSNPDLAWTGTEYLVVMEDGWNEIDGIWLERLDEQGRSIGNRRRLSGSIFGATFEPDIAFTGDGFGLVFVGNHETLYFQGFDAEGTPVTQLRNLLYRSWLARPEIVWNGEMFLVQFNSGDDERVEAVRLLWDGYRFGDPVVLSDGLPGHMWEFDRSGLAIGSDGRILSAFHRSYDPAAGVWSRVLGCCSQHDSDQDGSCMADCDDFHPGTYPGAPEVCDELDNDCDGVVVGEGPFEIVTGLGFSDPDSLFWSSVADPEARYDLQQGDLMQLRRESGDFTDSTHSCLVSNTALPEGQDPEAPAPGAGWYYLSSAGSDRCNGDFSGGGTGEAGDRNGGITSSMAACP